MTNTNTTPRRCWALLTSLLCLAALPLATSCGETNHAQAANNTTPTATSTPTTTSTQTAPQTNNPAPANTTHTASQHPNTRAKALANHAFSSLANAKPAPKTPTSRHLAIDDIELTSTSIHTQPGQPATLNKENTCYGANRTPALHWNNIPPNTAELAIFIISTTPVNNKLFYDWAITNINPHLHSITQGQTPPQATTTPNSTGHPNYTICPPPHKNETYLIALYALPHKLTTTPGTTPNQLHKQATHTATHAGLLVSSYQT